MPQHQVLILSCAREPCVLQLLTDMQRCNMIDIHWLNCFTAGDCLAALAELLLGSSSRLETSRAIAVWYMLNSSSVPSYVD
jgi:hypothetical protein